jgi:PLD-like domain
LSPLFFTGDFQEFFGALELRGKTVELITTCRPKGDDQLKKPGSLKSFGSAVKQGTGQWPSISLDQALHTKVYVFLKDSRPFAGIVTSANLTRSGLTVNHETGILLTDPDLLLDLLGLVRRQVDFINVNEYQVRKLCIAAADIASRGVQQPEDRDIGLGNLISKYCTPAEGRTDIGLREFATYYIKVSGVSDRPILPEHKIAFAEPRTPLSFAKSPPNMRIGDCLLEVAVGGKCFLSYYSCASEVFERTAEEKARNEDDKRWPYYVYANNLSIKYGKRWYYRPLYYDEVIERFKTEYPNTAVTKSGKDHFRGAMQRGHSYVPVTKEFGKFVTLEIDRYVCS